jgi:hypothetical protein
VGYCKQTMKESPVLRSPGLFTHHSGLRHRPWGIGGLAVDVLRRPILGGRRRASGIYKHEPIAPLSLCGIAHFCSNSLNCVALIRTKDDDCNVVYGPPYTGMTNPSYVRDKLLNSDRLVEEPSGLPCRHEIRKVSDWLVPPVIIPALLVAVILVRAAYVVVN